MRCAECGAVTAEATQTCALCGAPISQQRSVAASAPGGVEDAVAVREPAPPADQQVPQDATAGKRTGLGHSRRRVLALAGGGLAVLVGVIVVIGVASSSQRGQLTEDQLRPGDCLTGLNLGLDTSGPWPHIPWSAAVTAVPCTQRHEGEVFFSGSVWPRSLTVYPGDNALNDEADSRCLSALTTYDGMDISWSAFHIVPIRPGNASDWASGDRQLVCVAMFETP